MDTLIKNVTVIDGSGEPAFRGAVGMEKGKLKVFHGDTGDLSAKEIVDGTGLFVVPGFIDTHSHGDLTLSSVYPTASKITQGITTQVAGHCGTSMFPCVQDEQSFAEYKKFVSAIAPHPDMPEHFTFCESAKGFYDWQASLDTPVTTYSFVGHGSLRLWAMGYANRKPDSTELKRMQDMLRRCIREGALGLSTGLVYVPSRYADNEELLALMQVLKEEGGIYANHPRNEADTGVEARRETLDLVKQAGVPLNVSHLKIAGKDNWGKTKILIEDIDRALQDGVDLIIDSYPYLAGATSLNVSIPPKYLNGGMEGLCKALEDPEACRDMEKQISGKTPDYENYIYNSGGYSGVFVSSCPTFHDADGMRITEYAEKIGTSPFEAYRQILLKNGGSGLGIYFHMCEDDMLRILSHPLCAIGTDGLIGEPGENIHPRVFGTMPRAYHVLTDELHICSKEEAIRRMTGLPAEKLGLSGKGFLRDGYDADILLIDLDNFRDNSTYAKGYLRSSGIRDIWTGGKKVNMEIYK